MRHFQVGVAAVLLLGAVACKHDIGALQVETNAPNLRNDGGAAKSGDGGSGGSDAQGGSGGSDVVHPAPDPCQPCTEPSAAAKAAGLSSCCWGLRKEKCGLTFGGTSDTCLPMAVPGQASDLCPSGRKGVLQLDGCCRPDAHCGFNATVFGLGCVTRSDVPASVIGADIKAISCEYTCSTDDNCSGVTDHVCAESPGNASKRVCVHECQRDADCPTDQVCALTNDVGMDRVLAFCQAPLTDVAPGQACASADDCAQGVCLMNKRVCTQLCKSKTDCPTERPTCATAGIQRPSHTGDPIKFSICLP
jgi:hypothetical protein